MRPSVLLPNQNLHDITQKTSQVLYKLTHQLHLVNLEERKNGKIENILILHSNNPYLSFFCLYVHLPRVFCSGRSSIVFACGFAQNHYVLWSKRCLFSLPFSITYPQDRNAIQVFWLTFYECCYDYQRVRRSKFAKVKGQILETKIFWLSQ